MERAWHGRRRCPLQPDRLDEGIRLGRSDRSQGMGRLVGGGSGGARRRDEGQFLIEPRTARPSVTPGCSSLFDTTGTPATSTCRNPTEYFAGSPNFALSATVSGSKIARSREAPATPRSGPRDPFPARARCRSVGRDRAGAPARQPAQPRTAPSPRDPSRPTTMRAASGQARSRRTGARQTRRTGRAIAHSFGDAIAARRHQDLDDGAVVELPVARRLCLLEHFTVSGAQGHR